MIRAIIFDLDGTLIQTEVLKARSYARAIHKLSGQSVTEDEVLKSYKLFVGLSRAEVVDGLSDKFRHELKTSLNIDDAELLRQSILSERLRIYHDMISNPRILSAFICPYNLELLHSLHGRNYLIALATMSYAGEADKVLNVLDIKEKLSLIMTRDKVSSGKPDPEIYLKTMDRLRLGRAECLVIEDSVNGIKAGLNAGVKVFAVTNDFTRESVHAAHILPDEYIVDDLSTLKETVSKFLSLQ
ncbi:MAG: HAD family phosphatase [Bacteroidales bacterium]|nr:HAD family phosphatase [Bacteroidales bacterium]